MLHEGCKRYHVFPRCTPVNAPIEPADRTTYPKEKRGAKALKAEYGRQRGRNHNKETA